MNDIQDQFQRAAGGDDRSLDAAGLAALSSRARSRQHRRRVGVAGLGLAAVALLGVGVASAGGDHPNRQQLTASAGDGVPEVDDTTSSTVAPGTSVPPVTSQTDGGDASTSTVAPFIPPEVTTTSTANTTTVAPTDTEPAAATPGRVMTTGTFESRPAEAFTIDKRCPQIVSELDATMTTGRGESWSLHEDGCGELLDHMTQYSGGGPFTIAAGAGNTLTGTYTSHAPLPTDGEPYTLTITDGTGTWAGATGTCDLDNHMETLSTGKVRQYGTFACDVAVPTSPVQ